MNRSQPTADIKKVDLEKLKPLGRLANRYSEMQGLFSLPREE